jgi:hypothetical protein
MIHVGKNTRSRIVSKGISAGNSVNAYRGLVQIQPTARGKSAWGAGQEVYIHICSVWLVEGRHRLSQQRVLRVAAAAPG